ncbi:hypothetical protein DPMN_013630 [Dreissena polymorpha]|uniref:Uncharacterized protein n=1 Tax=Dreissena polymorpha TaxID=45954 RepID=A0A9D4N845_DREPO|nr:hypothetical protein DPMN_013630 [Dreissena polymorpha]
MIAQQEAKKVLTSCAHTPSRTNIRIYQQDTKTTLCDQKGSDLMRTPIFGHNIRILPPRTKTS